MFTQNPQQHLLNLDAVFSRLHVANSNLNWKKCHFFKVPLSFPCHVVSQRGMEIDPDKTSEVTHYPIPRFIGLLGF